MNNQIINLSEKFSTFSELWSPKIIGRLNNYHLKIAKICGEFIWHRHDETDEMFIVIEGSMDIHLRDKTIPLQAGEIFIVPKGVEHKPAARKECRIMMIEPAGTLNTGDKQDKLTKKNPEWI